MFTMDGDVQLPVKICYGFGLHKNMEISQGFLKNGATQTAVRCFAALFACINKQQV